MNENWESSVREAIKTISSIFREMSPSARSIRADEASPPQLRKAFASLGRGITLGEDDMKALVEEALEQGPSLKQAYVSASRINDILGFIDGTGIRKTASETLTHMLSNPASYNPPKVRINRGSRFPIYD